MAQGWEMGDRQKMRLRCISAICHSTHSKNASDSIESVWGDPLEVCKVRLRKSKEKNCDVPRTMLIGNGSGSGTEEVLQQQRWQQEGQDEWQHQRASNEVMA
jgi:hypothetical protein